ncbi:MAG: FAD-binding protein [Gammaproteobacteria bacterium]|nr:MAG: FAD-binding protein [Gammaproteobacteria bacterium]
MPVREPTPLLARHPDLPRRLAAVAPGAKLLTRPAEWAPYACDGLTARRRRPGMVAVPADAGEVAAILRLCHALEVPVVPRGAGTGLSGGALPREDALVLSLARLDRILEIDPEARTATVEPGVRNLELGEAVAPFGLFYAPDPSSQVACTLGGNVAENAGGVHCLKYGLTVHNLLAVDLVLMNGETVRLGGGGLDGPGLDLLPVVCGSEGLLGVVTRLRVRLLPRPESVRVVLAAFDALRRAGDAVAAVLRAGILPAGLEMMDRLALRAVAAYLGPGYPECEALLLCELDGCAEEAEALAQRVARCFAEGGAVEIQVARTPEACRRLWAGRKAAFPAMGRLAPDYYVMDGTLPRHRLGEVLETIAALAREHGLAVANVFHAGDGNLHPLILYDAGVPQQREAAEALGRRILEACVAAGGTITGEHGVGVEKLDAMCIQFGRGELERFHALRRAFDGKGLLNPGKAIPTLHRCAELGGMHVQRGRLPHPELERF